MEPLRPPCIGDYETFHIEVVDALFAIGNPKLSEMVRKDRGSELQYLGVRFPALHKRVQQGFSFSSLPDEREILIWDELWRTSPYGDVLFAALKRYLPIVRKKKLSYLWPVARHWIERVDNWCHCDGLSAVYSWILARDFDNVYPQIVEWNRSEDQWRRRASLVSLVHYTGKNSVFLPPEAVLPLVVNCLDDRRHYVQTAVGWVLREMSQAHMDTVAEFLETNAENVSAKALARAKAGR